MRRITPVLLIAALALGGCAAEEEPAAGAPAVLGFSTEQITVGETLGVYGRGLIGEDGEVAARLHFDGRFETDQGVEPVSLTVLPIADGQITLGGSEYDALRIGRFGPFNNPFSVNDRPGVFIGKVRVTRVGTDGAVTESGGEKVLRLEVGASLLIDELQPIDADCGAPAPRGLGGVPYRMTVRPVGLKAVRFVYELARINGNPGAERIEHSYDAPVGVDTLGVDELVAFNPVPEFEQFYVSTIRVTAYDAEGNTVETALPFSIHRPIEVTYDGKREVAERYEPVPVSGCIPGSVNSRVSYAEQRSETRQQSVSVTLSRSWSTSTGRTDSESLREGISVGESRSRSLSSSEREEENLRESYGVSYTDSESNNVSFSETDGESWSWNMRQGESETEYNERMNSLYGDVSGSVTVGAEAEGSVPGFAKVSGSVSTSVGARVGGSTGWTNGASQTSSSDRGFSAGGSSSESRSYGSTVSDSRSRSVNGAYALGRGSERSVSDREALENTRTWDLSEGSSVSNVVREGLDEAQRLTLVESTTESTLTSFSSTIPRNQYGIFYRQTTRLVRRAEVRSYNLCGLARHMGELQFNEFQWAPNLALGESCDGQPPASTLPAAACYIEPCGG